LFFGAAPQPPHCHVWQDSHGSHAGCPPLKARTYTPRAA
jgi:hypothetical protein